MRLLFMLFILSSTIFAHDIKLNIINIENIKGNLYIGVYKNKNNFPLLDKTYVGIIKKISSHNMKYTIKNIPNGIYAISVFHDENNNSKLDKSFLGIPTESYGFSNNIKPTFRSATFDESKFELLNDKNLTIDIE